MHCTVAVKADSNCGKGKSIQGSFSVDYFLLPILQLRESVLETKLCLYFT